MVLHSNLNPKPNHNLKKNQTNKQTKTKQNSSRNDWNDSAPYDKFKAATIIPELKFQLWYKFSLSLGLPSTLNPSTPQLEAQTKKVK
jgi:hypothetical protein